GILCRMTGSSVSKQAGNRFRAAFLLPLTVTSPASGRPPSMINLLIIPFQSGIVPGFLSLYQHPRRWQTGYNGLMPTLYSDNRAIYYADRRSDHSLQTILAVHGAGGAHSLWEAS